MNSYFIIIISIILLGSCNRKNIARQKDYSIYLQSNCHQNKIKTNEEALQFWYNKLKTDTGSYVYLLQIAHHKMKHFELQGNPNDLVYADSLLLICDKKLIYKEPSIYYALIQNAITQHQFKKADSFLQKLTQLGGDPYLINLLTFDVNMELGNDDKAIMALQKIGRKENNFDYLVRLSKYFDAHGKSDESMEQMEKGFEIAKKNAHSQQVLWSLTNLADKYSHEGKIQKSYEYYLKALQLDSGNLYALKGIATISFNKDYNVNKATEIIEFIQKNSIHPDTYLLLADMASWQGNQEQANNFTSLFMKTIENYEYGEMYNKYLIDLLLDADSTKKEGLEMAKRELNNRATPQTYVILAYAYYKNNDITSASSILKKHVLQKTFEPEALYLMSIIFQNENKELSQVLKKECEKSEFELGPAKFNLLRSIHKVK